MALIDPQNKSLKKSLFLVTFAITFGMVFFSIFGNPVGSPLFTGFMRDLGANDLVYSIVMALPVLGGIFQILGAYYLETTGKRKFLFLITGFINRLLWIPVALIPLFLPDSMNQTKIWGITFLIMLSSISGSVNSVTFTSWMGDLVPLDIAGRYFSRRSLISTISGAVAGIAVGIYVDQVNNFHGFAFVFIIGAVFGACDVSAFFFVKHPPLQRSQQKPSLIRILTVPFGDKNYIKLVVFATMFMFGLNVAAPFFNVYMLESLHMNFFMITLSNQIMSSISTVLIVQKWGSLCDRFGYKPILAICGSLAALCPMLWMFVTPKNIVMIFVINILSGIAWSGYNLAIFNQSVWLAPEANRSAYIACFTMMTSVLGTAVSYIAGGAFMQFVGPLIRDAHIQYIEGTYINGYQILFLLSGLLRISAVLLLLPLVQEKNAKRVGAVIRDVLFRHTSKE